MAWIYCLEEDYQVRSQALKGISFNNEWVNIEDCCLTLKAPYAWDGCSPKWKVLDLLTVGVPDGRLHLGKPITYYASGVHDVLCQYRHLIPLTKSDTVKLFDEMLSKVNFELRPIYVKAVDKYGPQDFLGDRLRKAHSAI